MNNYFYVTKIICYAVCVASVILSLSCDRKSMTGYHKYAPKKIANIETAKLMPSEAQNIYYKFEDCGFGININWKCELDEEFFLKFYNNQGMKILSQKPQDINIYFDYYNLWDMPEHYFFIYSPTVSSAGLYILYDRKLHILYGAYGDR